jgi:hypothetical protein
MDEASVKQVVDDHADAVVRGDMGHVTNDFCEEMRPQVPELGRALPLPVSEAEVRSLEVGADEAVARIYYKGDSGEITIESRWREIDGRPQIVSGQPVG